MTKKFSYRYKETSPKILLAYCGAGLLFLWIWYSSGRDWNMIAASVACFMVPLILYSQDRLRRKKPPVLAGDTHLLFLMTNSYPEGLELPWYSIKEIYYEMGSARRARYTLLTILTEDEKFSVDIEGLKNFDINQFQPLVEEIAPHIKWIWPNTVKS